MASEVRGNSNNSILKTFVPKMEWLKNPYLWGGVVSTICLFVGGGLIATGMTQFHLVSMALGYKTYSILLPFNMPVTISLLAGGGAATGLGVLGIKIIYVKKVTGLLNKENDSFDRLIIKALRLWDAIVVVGAIVGGGVFLVMGWHYISNLVPAHDYIYKNHSWITQLVGYYADKPTIYTAVGMIAGGSLLATVGILGTIHLLGTRTKVVHEHVKGVTHVNFSDTL
jgi:hypothetical protein